MPFALVLLKRGKVTEGGELILSWRHFRGQCPLRPQDSAGRRKSHGISRPGTLSVPLFSGEDDLLPEKVHGGVQSQGWKEGKGIRLAGVPCVPMCRIRENRWFAAIGADGKQEMRMRSLHHPGHHAEPEISLMKMFLNPAAQYIDLAMNQIRPEVNGL